MIGKPNCYPYSSKNVKGLEGNNWVSKEDGNGNLYIGHHLRGLSIVSLKDRTAKNYQHDPNNPYSIPDNEVRALCIDKNKNVWVGTNNGLALFNPQSEKFITFKHIEGNENSLLSDQILDIKTNERRHSMDMYQHGRSEYSQSQGKYIYISKKRLHSPILR